MTDDLESFARPTLPLGQTDDGDEVEVRVRTAPEKFVHNEWGEGLKFDADLVDSDTEFTDNNGETTVEPGDEVKVKSHSQRFGRALVDARAKAGVDDLLGKTVLIEKSGEGMDATYFAEVVDPDGDESDD